MRLPQSPKLQQTLRHELQINRLHMAATLGNGLCSTTEYALASYRYVGHVPLAQVNKKIFVRGLPWETNDQSLRAVFEQYGEIAEVSFVFKVAHTETDVISLAPSRVE